MADDPVQNEKSIFTSFANPETKMVYPEAASLINRDKSKSQVAGKTRPHGAAVADRSRRKYTDQSIQDSDGK